MSRPALWLTLSLAACSAEPVPPTESSAPSAAPSPAALSASASAPASPPGPHTPNEFYALGTPTFVAGTLGTDHEDLVIRRQIEWVRGALFPAAKIVDDTTIDPKAGPSAWPPNAVLYGGPQHNALLHALEAELPFSMGRYGLKIDGHTLDDIGVQVVMLVPARTGPIAHPAFVAYMGTGPEGVDQINGMPHGETAIAIFDGFDSVAAGGWQLGATSLVPQLNWAPPRPALDSEKLELSTTVATASISTVHDASYDNLPAKKAAIARGIATALKKLDITASSELRVVLYPNAESKKRFTHSAGNGHAMTAARMLHVVAFDEKPLERLIVHEATHVFTHQVWGPPGTTFMDEGTAVWISGQYGGTELTDWKKKLENPAPLATLLGIGFRRLPEREAYPPAGLVVGEIVGRVGLPKLRDGLWPATPQSWQAACERAGITNEELEKALR